MHYNSLLLFLPMLATMVLGAPVQHPASVCHPHATKAGHMECQLPRAPDSAAKIAELKAQLPKSCQPIDAAHPNKIVCKLAGPPIRPVAAKRDVANENDDAYTLLIKWKRSEESQDGVLARDVNAENDDAYSLTIKWKRDEESAAAVEARDTNTENDDAYTLLIKWKRDEESAAAVEARDTNTENDDAYTLLIKWKRDLDISARDTKNMQTFKFPIRPNH